MPVSSFLGVVCYQFFHLPSDFSSAIVEIAHLEAVVLPSKSQTDTLQAQIERRYSEVLLFLASVQSYCFWFALGTPPHVCIMYSSCSSIAGYCLINRYQGNAASVLLLRKHLRIWQSLRTHLILSHTTLHAIVQTAFFAHYCTWSHRKYPTLKSSHVIRCTST